MQYIIPMLLVKYIQELCNFFNFIQILFNHVLHDFLQQGYTPYGAPQPRAVFLSYHTVRSIDPLVDSTQVNDTVILYSSQNLDY
jgi:hypothetical protein